MEHWEPKPRPLVSPRGTRTIAVSVSPREGRNYHDVQYKVYLENNHTYEIMGPEYTNITHTEAKFYNVPDGTYFALMKVSECDDCTVFKSSNAIKIPAPEPSLPEITLTSLPPPNTTTTDTSQTLTTTTIYRNTLQTLATTTTYISQTLTEDSGSRDSTASRSVLIRNVVGGCLGGILILVVLVISVVICRNKFKTACCSVVKDKSVNDPEINLSTRSLVDSNNI
ncbi:uncharacterized protein [Diadema antillarum]